MNLELGWIQTLVGGGFFFFFFLLFIDRNLSPAIMFTVQSLGQALTRPPVLRAPCAQSVQGFLAPVLRQSAYSYATLME